ncbi:MAG TPA: nuclear transport factor 2 family protein [Streptosporangiaceae bacterium]|nr:nuclear transport factor 2 family protein [Streptosporangiaceae bacterium]
MTPTDLADLDRRLRRIEDRAEIQELGQRYCRYIDDNDWTRLRGLFTDGAAMAGQTGGDAVVATLRAIRSGYGRTIHTAYGLVLEELDDDHARGYVPSSAQLDIGGEFVVSAIRYFDTYARVGGTWKFASRDLRFVYALPWSQSGLALVDGLPVRWPGTEPAPADDLSGGPR